MKLDMTMERAPLEGEDLRHWLRHYRITDRQSLFAFNLGILLHNAAAGLFNLGYFPVRVRLGEGYVGDSVKPHESPLHQASGGHFLRMAQDIILDVEGQWIQGRHPIYLQMGRFWKSLHGANRWGGDFASRDYNHFSMVVGMHRDGREIK